MTVYAESGTQGRCEQSASRGGSDERKGRQAQLHRARTRPLVDHDVDAEILHGRVEILLDYGAEAVNLVDEEHIVLFERGEYAGKVAGLVEHGARRDFYAHAELVGHNLRQSSLAEAGRAVQQHVVERLASHAGGRHKHPQVLDYLVLTAERVKLRRTQRLFKVGVAVLAALRGAYVKVFTHLGSTGELLILLCLLSFAGVCRQGSGSRRVSMACCQTPSRGGRSWAVARCRPLSA